MNTSTYKPASHVHFENAVGRQLVHPAGHYVAIEYNTGPRQASEVHAFLLEAGNLLIRWGWDKVMTVYRPMPDFTLEEVEHLCAYWHANVPKQHTILFGALLLPHAVFDCLSWKVSLKTDSELLTLS